MNRRSFLTSTLIAGGSAIFSAKTIMAGVFTSSDDPKIKKIVKSDAEWKKILNSEQYEVTRQKGTERPYSSPLNDIHDEGLFLCVSCDLPLFSSKTKFDSHTGWPSFWAPIDKRNIRQETDNSLAETRVEVLCNRCDAHLGHVFEDGPPPTGLRYCMNGVALKFVKKADNKRDQRG